MSQLLPLYPLQFIPQLKEKVWGGNKLHTILNKVKGTKLGESWEISGVEDAISVVAFGSLKGNSLKQLITVYGSQLLGEKVMKQYGAFPLLFKFIDAAEDLSIQLHPDDALAQKRHKSLGKTEMWYVLQADENARLLLGFKDEINKQQYLKSLEAGTLADTIHSQKVAKGDSFFVAPGTIHAIGAGVLLAEIQQTSDVTYRVYDWNRPDIDGNLRELHTELALDAINFSKTNALLHYEDIENEVVPICDSPYFHVSKLKYTKSFSRDYNAIDSFVVYMCVEGTTRLRYGEELFNLNKGESILIPASIKEIHFETLQVTILEIFVP